MQALPNVWLITDKGSGSLSYLQVGNDQTSRLLGPFAYSTEREARQAAKNPTFMPRKVAEAVTLDVVEVPGISLIEGILSGFAPSGSDVFSLNENLLPLTKNGASWVDETTGSGEWMPLFKSPPSWLKQILLHVSLHMGVEDIEIMAQNGNKPGSRQSPSHSDTLKAKALIKEHVQIVVVPEIEMSEGLNPDGTIGTIGPKTTFWVHTRGMEKFERPDLEIRQVPAWFINYAVATIKGWAVYSLNKEIKAGERIQEGGVVPVIVQASVSKDPYWIGRNLCLTFNVEQVLYQCEDWGLASRSDENLH